MIFLQLYLHNTHKSSYQKYLRLLIPISSLSYDEVTSDSCMSICTRKYIHKNTSYYGTNCYNLQLCLHSHILNCIRKKV